MKEKESAAPVRNVKMVVEYDGTNYAGWQSQTNALAIQDVIEPKLSMLACRKVHITASGRTDAGVHALGQVFNVKAPFPVDDDRLMRILNSRLPNDISIKSAETVPMDFHSIRDAVSKKYRYFLYNSRDPSAWLARTSWFFPAKLDMDRMREAVRYFVGRHDFTSFMGKNSSVKTTVRNILSFDIAKDERGMIIFEIVGEGFLRHMVRNIVGTLTDVGRWRMAPDDIPKLIEKRDRTKAGPTAAARGLFLVEVNYK